MVLWGAYQELIRALRDILNGHGGLGWSASVGHTKCEVKVVEFQREARFIR